MKTIIFSPAIYNLSETTRAIEVAKVCNTKFDVLFISYGGEFEYLIEQEGFKLVKLNPQLTKEKIKYLYQINQMRKLGEFFSEKEIKEQVKNEIEFFNTVSPICVVTGFDLSNSISCRVLKIPLVYLTQSTWKIRSFLQAGLGSYPDQFDVPVLQLLPEKLLIWIALKLYYLYGNYVLAPYNKVAKIYGLKGFKHIEELWEGDYNLVAEPKGFSDLTLPLNYYFIGPLITKIDVPVPKEILNIPKDKPIIYFAMGSSGQPKVISKIIESFENKPFYVIAPVRSHLKNIKVKIPKNVIVTDWISAHKINPMASLSIVHGGIGTLMTACLSGTPIISIPLQFEQELNAECLVRKGFAIRINKRKLNSHYLLETVSLLLNNEAVKHKAKEFQKTVQKWGKENPLIMLDFFEKYFND